MFYQMSTTDKLEKPRCFVSDETKPKKNFSALKSLIGVESKNHFVIEDLINHKDFSWFIQPVGFVSSIVLFPSHVFLGMFTTIQESLLLDLQCALDSNERDYIAARMKNLNSIHFRICHMEIVSDFVVRMSKKTFIQKLPIMNPTSSTNAESENDVHLTNAALYYKRYLKSAVGMELFIRNPVKYDGEFPVTGMLSKVTVGGVSAVILVSRFMPALDALEKAATAKETFAKYKLIHGAFAATAKTVKSVILNRMKVVLFAAKYRKPLFVLGIALNAGNIAIWALEVRK